VFWSGATDGPSNRLAFERAAGGAWRSEVWPG
jgi:pyridoxamine 5'-phosphate oxidase